MSAANTISAKFLVDTRTDEVVLVVNNTPIGQVDKIPGFSYLRLKVLDKVVDKLHETVGTSDVGLMDGLDKMILRNKMKTDELKAAQTKTQDQAPAVTKTNYVVASVVLSIFTTFFNTALYLSFIFSWLLGIVFAEGNMKWVAILFPYGWYLEVEHLARYLGWI